MTDFELQGTAAPAEIGELRIILRLPRGGAGVDTTAEYRFEVLDASGERLRVRENDLAPHLTSAQKTSIANFMNAMKAKAVASLTG